MSDETVVHFLFSKESIDERLRWKDIKRIRKFSRDKSGEFDEEIQNLACRFMADADGKYLPFDQAYLIFDELSKREAMDAITKFSEVFAESTVPNGNGGPSN